MGNYLNLWAKVVGELQGQEIHSVYVRSDLETVDQLWPELGKEMGLMLKVLERLVKKAWTKNGVSVVTIGEGWRFGEYGECHQKVESENRASFSDGAEPVSVSDSCQSY